MSVINPVISQVIRPVTQPPTKPPKGGSGGNSPLSRNLVSYWDLNDATTGTATTASDSTSTNDLTKTGAGVLNYSTTRKKIISSVTRGGGTSAYLRKASPSGLTPSGDWSAAVWVYYNTGYALSIANEFLMGVWTTAGDQRSWQIVYEEAAQHPDGSIGIYVETSSDGTAATVTQLGDNGAAASLNNWYFAQVRYSSGPGKLELRINDGAWRSVTGVDPLHASTGEFFISKSDGCFIQLAGFWSRKLSNKNFDDLYEAGYGRDYTDLTDPAGLWTYADLDTAESSGDNWQNTNRIRTGTTADSVDFKYYSALAVDGYSGLIHRFVLNNGVEYTPTLVGSEGADDPDTWANYTDNPAAGVKDTDYAYDTNAGRARMRDLGTATDSRFQLDSNEDTDSITSANGFAILDDIIGTNTLDESHASITMATRLDASNIYFTVIQERIVSASGNATNWVIRSGASTWTSSGLGKTTAGRFWVYIVGSSLAVWVGDASAPVVTGTTSSTAATGFPRLRFADGNATNSDDTKIEIGPHVFGTLA